MLHSPLKETESDYLISSRRQKCKDILAREDLDEEDLIEFYIALHVVLEVGLNALLRHLALWHAQSFFDKAEIIDQVDDVNFKDKVAIFLYHAQFDFMDQHQDVEKHHDILKKIVHFSEIRNELLHGHAISTFILDGKSQDSDVRRKMNQATLTQQINLFKDIIKGMHFFLDHLIDSSKEKIDKESLKNKYLDIEFLRK